MTMTLLAPPLANLEYRTGEIRRARLCGSPMAGVNIVIPKFRRLSK